MHHQKRELYFLCILNLFFKKTNDIKKRPGVYNKIVYNYIIYGLYINIFNCKSDGLWIENHSSNQD